MLRLISEDRKIPLIGGGGGTSTQRKNGGSTGGGISMHFGGQGSGPGMKILGLKTVANKLPESQPSKIAFDRQANQTTTRKDPLIGRLSEVQKNTTSKFSKLHTESDTRSPFKKGGLPIGLLKSTPSKEAHSRFQ
jgi:hypothetical protein